MKYTFLLVAIFCSFWTNGQEVAKQRELLSQSSSISMTQVNYKNKKRNARIVSVRSEFNHRREFFFEQEMKIANTLIITRPMAKIRLLNGQEHETWQEGFTYQMRILSYGFLPFGGVHEIYIEEINDEETFVQTREKNKIVKIWDHRLRFQSEESDVTSYEDKVTIYAGWMTPIFASYLKSFYKMRHRKWNKLLNQMAT